MPAPSSLSLSRCWWGGSPTRRLCLNIAAASQTQWCHHWADVLHNKRPPMWWAKKKTKTRAHTNQSALRCVSLGWLLLCCCLVFVPVGVSPPVGGARPPLADGLRVFILHTRTKRRQSEGFHLPPPSMTHQGSAALESCLKKQTARSAWTPQGIDNILTLLVLLRLNSYDPMWRSES